MLKKKKILEQVKSLESRSGLSSSHKRPIKVTSFISSIIPEEEVTLLLLFSSFPISTKSCTIVQIFTNSYLCPVSELSIWKPAICDVTKGLATSRWLVTVRSSAPPSWTLLLSCSKHEVSPTKESFWAGGCKHRDKYACYSFQGKEMFADGFRWCCSDWGVEQKQRICWETRAAQRSFVLFCFLTKLTSRCLQSITPPL